MGSSWTRDWTCVPCTGRWGSKPLDQQASPILLLFLLQCMTIQSILHICGFCIHRVRRRHWHPTPVLLPGKSHGRRSLVGYSPWGREQSDTTERLHSHFSLSCTGEGNGNPLQCSCLENPRDGGAWRAAVYGVAQSRTWLKWLSSISSIHRVNQLWIEKFWKKSIPQSPKKQNLNLWCSGNYLHSFYTVFAMIHIALMLH